MSEEQYMETPAQCLEEVLAREDVLKVLEEEYPGLLHNCRLALYNYYKPNEKLG